MSPLEAQLRLIAPRPRDEEIAALRIENAGLRDANADLLSRLSLQERQLQFSGGLPAARAVWRWRQQAQSMRSHQATAHRLMEWESELHSHAQQMDSSMASITDDISALHRVYSAALHERDADCARGQEHITALLAQRTHDAARHQRETARLTALAASAQASALGMLQRVAAHDVEAPPLEPTITPDDSMSPEPEASAAVIASLSSNAVELAAAAILECAMRNSNALCGGSPQHQVLGEMVSRAAAQVTSRGSTEEYDSPAAEGERKENIGAQDFVVVPRRTKSPLHGRKRGSWEEWKARQEFPSWINSAISTGPPGPTSSTASRRTAANTPLSRQDQTTAGHVDGRMQHSCVVVAHAAEVEDAADDLPSLHSQTIERATVEGHVARDCTDVGITGRD